MDGTNHEILKPLDWLYGVMIARQNSMYPRSGKFTLMVIMYSRTYKFRDHIALLTSFSMFQATLSTKYGTDLIKQQGSIAIPPSRIPLELKRYNVV
jgi:hypothetical protein